MKERAILLDRLIGLRNTYRDGLLQDTIPFWLKHSVDHQFGGYLTCLNRDGGLLQTDKSVWFQGRMAWMFSTLYLTIEPREEWLSAARSGVEFLKRHCFDTDGRMFFSVTQDGQPLRKRRYLYSECFAIIAFAAFGRATGDSKWIEQARQLLVQVMDYHTNPSTLEPKTNPETRRSKGLAMPMILMVTAQELRKALAFSLCQEIIDLSIDEIQRDFLKTEFRCLLEMVGPEGELIDTFDGRCINPGHSLEAGWFIMEEARVRGGDADLIRLGAKIVDWSLEWGWDEQHGGILYYRDAKGLPCTEYWHDMKFWWPHNEAIIAALLAWHMTGEDKYANWHNKVHDWAYAKFPDPEYGEWFGYLHRDGSLSTMAKGTLFKGFFHLPRMQWYCWQRLDEMIKENTPKLEAATVMS